VIVMSLRGFATLNFWADDDKPGGAIMYWHVEDLAATVERLIALGATEFEPITPRGDTGFVTASVVDPFGNVLGVMYNPHYVDVRDARVS
jgi:predicted enzyme related to lactoylglutathione lyase